MLRLYLNPEQPPGSTPTRRPAVSGDTCSSAMNLRTSAAALSVSVRAIGVAFCVVAMIYPPMREQVSHVGPACQPPACVPARRSHNWGASTTGSHPHAPRLPRLVDHRAVLRLQRGGRSVLRAPLRRPAGRFPARLPSPLLGSAHQLHHPGLGEPRDGEDSPVGLHRLEG